MSRNLERALDALTDPRQRTYWTHGDQVDGEPPLTPAFADRCFRCGAPVDPTGIGACEPCRAWMRGDTDEDPADASGRAAAAMDVLARALRPRTPWATRRRYLEELRSGGEEMIRRREEERQAFEERYASRSGLTVDELHHFGLYGVPCDCGEPVCEGWQMDWERRALRAAVETVLDGDARPPVRVVRVGGSGETQTVSPRVAAVLVDSGLFALEDPEG